VLLTTTPGPVLASGDVVRLYGLLERAQRRLSSEAADDTVDTVLARLRALALAVRRSPTDRGLALFASESRAEAVHLGVMVDDRVVVDPTFATRDLVRAFHANPRYRLLVLSEHRARFMGLRITRLTEGFDDGPAHEGEADGVQVAAGVRMPVAPRNMGTRSHMAESDNGRKGTS
jgi:hypothetical protein